MNEKHNQDKIKHSGFNYYLCLKECVLLIRLMSFLKVLILHKEQNQGF